MRIGDLALPEALARVLGDRLELPVEGHDVHLTVHHGDATVDGHAVPAHAGREREIDRGCVDRVVGYQLVREGVDSAVMEQFLTRLTAAGIQPDEVFTDGSALYPGVLADVWPQAAHQLYLFHETRRLTMAAQGTRGDPPGPSSTAATSSCGDVWLGRPNACAAAKR